SNGFFEGIRRALGIELLLGLATIGSGDFRLRNRAFSRRRFAFEIERAAFALAEQAFDLSRRALTNLRERARVLILFSRFFARQAVGVFFPRSFGAWILLARSAAARVIFALG